MARGSKSPSRWRISTPTMSPGRGSGGIGACSRRWPKKSAPRTTPICSSTTSESRTSRISKRRRSGRRRIARERMCIAMMSATTFRASWRIALAAALLAAAPLVHIARTENIVGGVLAAGSLDPAASEGPFRHLRALQDLPSASGGTRAAGTLGYDRSTEYVAERLQDAGYLVRLEEFEFPFFQERAPPALLL